MANLLSPEHTDQYLTNFIESKIYLKSEAKMQGWSGLYYEGKKYRWSKQKKKTHVVDLVVVTRCVQREKMKGPVEIGF